MIVKCWSPKVPWGMRMTVSCSCISRLASLYGLVTRISSTTPGRTSSVLASIELVLPVIPIAVRVGPGIGCGTNPIWRIASNTRSIWANLEWPCITTSIDVTPNASWQRAKRQRVHFPFFERLSIEWRGKARRPLSMAHLFRGRPSERSRTIPARRENGRHGD